ncbi:MAG: AMP-binding protein [Treponema sp.]|jgi:long-chain acyl-CoA synthetase|nr:AMP-binding protein [Treponema sp.]
MKTINRLIPWKFLDDYRGKLFAGEWPTLPEMFRITTERYGDRSCFTDFAPDKITYTYRQVLENCKQLASWMAEQGVKKGERVAVCGKNSSEWATVYLAALFANAIIVPIDFGLHDTEISNLLNTAQPKLFFIDEEKYDYFAANSSGARMYSLSPKYEDIYVYHLRPRAYADVKSELAEDDTAAILFTSGTTGTPKGVMLSHKNLVSDCYIAQTNLVVLHTDVFYALLPLHHSYTMLAVLIEALSTGAEVVFGKSMAVTRMLRELREGKITMLLGVPLLFNKLLAGILKGIKEKGFAVYGIMSFLMSVSFLIKKLFGVNPGKKIFRAVLEKASISTIRVAICGGGPLAKSVFRIYQELGIDFIQGYGLTETSPIIALNPLEHFKIASVGQYFHPYMEMTILDPDESGIGEVAVKGSMVMQGYYNLPEDTKAVFTEDGWFKTGDLGTLDSERYLYLYGRAKNMIVTEGGKNVYPEEIENAFQLFTDIEQITIRGYIAEKSTKSEGIEALVYPSDDLLKRLGINREDKNCSKAVLPAIREIIDRVNKIMPSYSKISSILILDKALEMTTTKKVKRNF